MNLSFILDKFYRLNSGAGKLFAVLLFVTSISVLIGCSESQSESTTAPTPDAAQSTDSKTSSEGNSGATDDSTENKTENEPANGNPIVLLKTTKGDIKIELNPQEAPITVENFLSYVNDGFYDGTIFHRVIPKFMIQGGGMTPDMNQKKTKSSIKNEADNGLKNDRGTISMARMPSRDSATSQFFINLVDNSVLDHGVRDFGYAVFGKVIDGMDVVDRIAVVETRPGDIPKETVIIQSATVIE